MGWTPPVWVYVGKRPDTDRKYFSNLTRVIFTAGLNWNTIEVKWVGLEKAFDAFSIDRVAKYNDKDVKRLMGDAGIIRNKAKITATIHNAKQMQEIAKEHGSFQHYLDSLDKSNNYSKVAVELIKRFKHVGKSTAEMFLWSGGEDVDPEW
jgi:DNA-3-methyladenine glycosylase I